MYRDGQNRAEWVKQVFDAYKCHVRANRASLPPTGMLRDRAVDLFDHPTKAFTAELAAKYLAAEAAGEPTASIWATVADRQAVS